MKNSSRIKLGLLSVAILSSLSLITGYNVVSASEQNIPLYTTNQTNTNLKVLLTDGALIRTSDTGIYLLENGVKYPFINPEIFDSYNYSYQNVEVIDKATFDLIPTGKAMPIRSGMLIRANTSPNVYVIEDGMKRRIDNPGVSSIYIGAELNLCTVLLIFCPSESLKLPVLRLCASILASAEINRVAS